MDLERNVCILLVVSLCSARPNYDTLSPAYGVPRFDLPQYPQSAVVPHSQNLVYQYIANLAGYHNSPQVAIAPTRIEDFGIVGEPFVPDGGNKEPVTENPPQPLQPSHLLPSDFVLLANSPQSQFFGHFDVVKNKKFQTGVNNQAPPAIGGVLSNYILQRNANDKQQVKRQTFAYSRDGDDDQVVIDAAAPAPHAAEQASSASGANSSASDSAEQKEEPQPSVAQSKPSAIAVAGPGGVAQAAPVATAVVGKDGLAIAAPSATAVAGRGAQGAIQIGGEEKQRVTSTTSESTKKKTD